MVFLWLPIVSMIVTSPLVASLNNSTLRFVQILFRHGDRSPMHYLYLPSDPENMMFPWYDSHNGIRGELSKEGIDQLYNVGVSLRQRYGFLVNNTYDASELFVASGKANTTISSALALLAGMFPPNSNQIWNSQLNWQPIPVHIVDYIDESGLILTSCPVLLKSLEQSQSFQEELKSRKSLIDFVTLKSGFRKDVGPLINILNIFDNLKTREMHNNTHPLPKWANQMPSNFSFQNFLGRFMWAIYNDPAILHAVSGLFLYQLTDQMMQYIHKENAHKFYFYAVHDVNIMAIAKALKLKNFDTESTPNYGSYLSVELHEIDENYYVQLWFRNGLDGEQQLLQLALCPDPCSFEHFKQLIPLLLVEQWDEVCKGQTVEAEEIRHLKIGTVILSITCLVLFGLLIFCRFKRRKNHNREEEEPLLINK